MNLWIKLTFMTHSSEESSYLFVLRCIELRQKILIASTKSDLNFDKPLLDKAFCLTLERGLSTMYVVQEIRHLPRAGVSDEELIFEVSKSITRSFKKPRKIIIKEIVCHLSGFLKYD